MKTRIDEIFKQIQKLEEEKDILISQYNKNIVKSHLVDIYEQLKWEFVFQDAQHKYYLKVINTYVDGLCNYLYNSTEFGIYSSYHFQIELDNGFKLICNDDSEIYIINDNDPTLEEWKNFIKQYKINLFFDDQLISKNTEKIKHYQNIIETFKYLKNYFNN